MFSASGQCVFVESGHEVSEGTWLLLATVGGVLCKSWSKNKTKQKQFNPLGVYSQGPPWRSV